MPGWVCLGLALLKDDADVTIQNVFYDLLALSPCIA